MSPDIPEGSGPLVEVDDLWVSLGGTRILRGVDATMDRGRFVGLVGPNGAGKTTLLRTITGAITPDSGSITVAGERIGDLSSKATSRLVTTVPQDTTVAFEFDVRTVVGMGRHPHRSRIGGWTNADTAAVERALDRTDTQRFADRVVTTLSGGERQRVLLARALAQETPVLLLDEPTGSLDINHQVRTLELVRDLVAGGRTVIAAIHDLDLAARYCDHLLLLSGGDVVADGTPASVLTESAVGEAFDARATIARHPVTGAVSVTALPDDHERETDAGRVHVVGDDAAVRHLYTLDAAGFEVSVGAVNEGSAVAETARSLGIDTVTVDIEDHEYVDIVGDAASKATLREAGVERADAIIVGLPDDSSSLLTTVLARSLNPDIEILTRVSDTDATGKALSGGADYVLPVLRVSARMVARELRWEDVLAPASQIRIVRVSASPFAGSTLAESGIYETTGCRVIAVEDDGGTSATVVRIGRSPARSASRSSAPTSRSGDSASASASRRRNRGSEVLVGSHEPAT